MLHVVILIRWLKFLRACLLCTYFDLHMILLNWLATPSESKHYILSMSYIRPGQLPFNLLNVIARSCVSLVFDCFLYTTLLEFLILSIEKFSMDIFFINNYLNY